MVRFDECRTDNSCNCKSHLDARNNVLGLQDINERSAIIGLLVESLLEKDNTRNVLLDAYKEQVRVENANASSPLG